MPAIGSVHKAQYSLRDATGELGRFQIFNDAITAASLPGYLAQLGNFETALLGITLGILANVTWIGDDSTISNAAPTDPAAQREAKLLVQYMDATTQKPATLTIPTVDFSKLVFLSGAGDAVAFKVANGASAEIIAWVAAFEAVASPPDNPGNGVIVTGMRFVGRNN